MIGAVVLTLALAGLLLLAARWRPPLGGGQRMLLAFYALLGAIAYAVLLFGPAQDPPGVFAHAKPTIFYWGLALVLVAAPQRGYDVPVKSLLGAFLVLSRREWLVVNAVFALACGVLGAVNLYIAQTHPDSDWDGFKWGCMVNVVAAIFLRVTFIWVEGVVRALVGFSAWRARRRATRGTLSAAARPPSTRPPAP